MPLQVTRSAASDVFGETLPTDAATTLGVNIATFQRATKENPVETNWIILLPNYFLI